MPKHKWDDGNFYGRKLARYFTLLNGLIEKLLTNDALSTDDADKVIKIMGRQNQTIYTIQKLSEHLDTTKRISDIEKLIDSIPPEAIAAAKARMIEVKSNH